MFEPGGDDEAAPESNIFREADPFGGASFHDDDDFPMPVHSTPAPAVPPSPFAAPPSASSAPPSLTEEQRRRMELNRQRALERRLARQQQQTQGETRLVNTASSRYLLYHYKADLF